MLMQIGYRNRLLHTTAYNRAISKIRVTGVHSISFCTHSIARPQTPGCLRIHSRGVERLRLMIHTMDARYMRSVHCGGLMKTEYRIGGEHCNAESNRERMISDMIMMLDRGGYTGYNKLSTIVERRGKL
jgi:hypothetical protein